MQRLLIALVLFCIALPPVMAETRYVVDTLIITVRSGKGEQFRIIKTIPSGTAMEILESDEEWSQVRLKDGTEGWVLNQYISATPTARQRLAQAEQQVEKLQRSNDQLQSERERLRSETSTLGSSSEQLSSENKKLTEELTELRRIAARPQQIEAENQKLREDYTALENELTILRQKNQVLQDSSNREWFLTGAGVIIVGILIGLIAPRLRPKKKSGWDSL